MAESCGFVKCIVVDNAKIIDKPRFGFYVSSMTNERALEFLIQTAGSQKRLADILDTSDERVSRWANKRHKPPTWLVVIAEFLERTPPKDWPERWK